LRAEVIDTWADLARLQGRWNALLEASSADSIFLTWEWIESWRAAGGASVEPLTIVVWDGEGELVGLAPLYLASMRLGGIVAYRTLRVLGDYQSGAEYLDWILARDREEEAARLIVDALARQRSRWDCIWIPNLAGWTGACDRIAAACLEGGFYAGRRGIDFSAVDLPGDYESYLRSVSHNLRSTLRRQGRRVFDGPDVSFELLSREADLPPFLDALVDLNHRRWSALGQDGTFVRKPLELRFCRNFAPRALARGWLRLFAIRRGSRFEAVQMGYTYRHVFHQFQEGFDPLAARGVGNVLRSRVIRHCIEEGVHTYDFLGGHTAHKRRWRSRPRPGHDLLIGRPCLKNSLIFSAGVWPTGRYLRATALPVAS
jgi:CelD/BcsL family acetyltransferase involved in cellulose biosynthesis